MPESRESDSLLSGYVRRSCPTKDSSDHAGTPRPRRNHPADSKVPSAPPCNKEAVSQFKIMTKRRPNRELYLKISIQFRKISNYGTASKLRAFASHSLGFGGISYFPLYPVWANCHKPIISDYLAAYSSDTNKDLSHCRFDST